MVYLYRDLTCIDEIIVLSVYMVAQSLTVDRLSKAPWVSISSIATYSTNRSDTFSNLL